MKFELEIVKFGANDVITTSNCPTNLGKKCDIPELGITNS